MKPNTNVENSFNEQKQDLLVNISEQAKLPISDILIHSFNDKTYKGLFTLYVDTRYKVGFPFKYENKVFYWEISTILNDLESKWSHICAEHQTDFNSRIAALLVTSEDELTISTGKLYYVYVRKSGEPQTAKVACEFQNNVWTFRIEN